MSPVYFVTIVPSLYPPESSPVKGEDSYPSVSQFKTFFITSVRLSLVSQERFDFRMAFGFAGIPGTPYQSGLLQISIMSSEYQPPA